MDTTFCSQRLLACAGSLLPLNVPKGVRVVVHPPIDVDNMTLSEGELCAHVYSLVNSALPEYQQGPPVAPAASSKS